MMSACAGAQVISTVQARVDGSFPSTRTPFPKGARFRWFGEPLRLDGARAAMLLPEPLGQAELRGHLPAAIAKLGRSRGALPAAEARPIPDAQDDPDALILTDGAARWSARMIETATGETLLLFDAGLPPANATLRIAQSPVLRVPPPLRETICFVQGTQIETENGPRAIEDLDPGDRVLTRDDGLQPIEWMGMRRISGARLYAMPGLRPVRLRVGAVGSGQTRDILLSPGHQVLLSGAKPRALFGTDEVLVRARDLRDDRWVTEEHGLGEVIYIHLLFRRHQVIWANGLPCESFHPADADLDHLNPVDVEELHEIAPPGGYGPHARRCLSPAELAILRHEGAPRYLS
ncbi:Hint domain-containing protein [Jannaschia ovalis]|uniref:Hint domain-containing protein n=1 Tax=Jannaschia ovalis TaxID=3038773 RepID=A0ABY8LDF1_9RHOB|nr:Hint domain-containing protein [Jannaschia sp. GRR-S6-38]WGH79344.1 Hint domain-containing protein [Jannaschia sp. GRR-S6-38]